MPNFEYFSSLGIAGIILAFLGISLWKAGKFAGEFCRNVFLDTNGLLALCREWVDTQKKALEQQRQAIERLEDSDREQQRLCSEHINAIAGIARVLDELANSSEKSVELHGQAVERIQELEKWVHASCQKNEEG